MMATLSEDLKMAFVQNDIADHDLDLFLPPVKNAMIDFVSREQDPETRQKRIEEVVRLVNKQKRAAQKLP